MYAVRGRVASIRDASSKGGIGQGTHRSRVSRIALSLSFWDTSFGDTLSCHRPIAGMLYTNSGDAIPTAGPPAIAGTSAILWDVSYITSSYKTSSYQTSSYRTSRIQNVQDTKRPVTKRPVTKRPGYKTSSTQNVQFL
jgi:hypothetical protein